MTPLEARTSEPPAAAPPDQSLAQAEQPVWSALLSNPDSSRDLIATVIDPLPQELPLEDRAFDQVYEERWQHRSSRYWSPVAVARRAASWFEERGGRRVLDVGSGAGKACIVGAMTTELEFVGIEQRAELVDVAQRAAKALGVDARASFIHGMIAGFDASTFDCMYLYNPFAENLYADETRIDDSVELSASRFLEDVHAVEGILSAAIVGTKVITYYGFGGRVPNSFAPIRTALMGDDSLRLWEKRREKSTGYYVDLGHTAVRFGHIEKEQPTYESVSGR